ncbi:MAG: TldD/PmbA family protein [Actinomycetota bacterium]
MLDDLLELGDRIVARANDGEQIEAIVVNDRETEVRVFEGDVESFTSATSQGIGIRVIAEQRQGFAWAGSLDPEVIDSTLAEARDNASFGSIDPDLALAEPDGVEMVELDLYDPAIDSFPTDDKINLALDLERMAQAGDPRIMLVESVDFADSSSEAAVVTTSGIRIGGRDSGCYVSAAVIAGDDDETQIGFGYSVARNPADLDLDKAASMSVERSTRLLGAVKPQTGRFTVVLDPMVTAQFIGIIGGTLSGEAVLKGRSLFADRVDESVASSLITLVDDPTNPKAFTAGEADGEGLATRRNVLIEDGRLNQFVHNSYTGRRLGTASTGNAVRGFTSTPGTGTIALSLAPGAREQAELIADIEDGVLIQGVSGLHSGVNPVSGDFSTGADGLRIRNGELAEPLREFTIGSTLQRMLLDVIEVGGDIDWLPSSAAGLSLVVGDVTVSGA